MTSQIKQLITYARLLAGENTQGLDHRRLKFLRNILGKNNCIKQHSLLLIKLILVVFGSIFINFIAVNTINMVTIGDKIKK